MYIINVRYWNTQISITRIILVIIDTYMFSFENSFFIQSCDDTSSDNK